MSNIKTALQNKKALIPFITCGDPDLELTKKAVIAMEEAGADAVILGIPFSDPTAEGPVVYEANLRALSSGITTDDILKMAKELRNEVSVPLMFMTYANVAFSYGAEQFISNCHEAGVDGIVLFDLPYEEREEFAPICEKYDVDLVSFVAPLGEERIAKVAKKAQGLMFVMGTADSKEISEIVKVVKENTDVPCVAGFDDLTYIQAEKMAGASDGIAICTDIVKLVEKYGKEAVEPISNYVKDIKKAMA